jgi:heme-degrading monooxygenase HmoA
MIQHTVVFKLKYPKGSAAEKRFLEAAMQLASIPGVSHFKRFRQISKKNVFEYGLSMEFESNAAYDAYNLHPDHTAFLKDFWSDGVADFLEIDYEPLT